MRSILGQSQAVLSSWRSSQSFKFHFYKTDEPIIPLQATLSWQEDSSKDVQPRGELAEFLPRRFPRLSSPHAPSHTHSLSLPKSTLKASCPPSQPAEPAHYNVGRLGRTGRNHRASAYQNRRDFSDHSIPWPLWPAWQRPDEHTVCGALPKVLCMLLYLIQKRLPGFDPSSAT